MRTLVYIDGLNLYYGCLKAIPQCRWLDVEAFARYMCNEVNPESEVVGVKYFNAPVLASLSPRGDVSRRSLENYMRALRHHCDNIEIIEGKHFRKSRKCHLNQNPVDFENTYDVIVPEEKQTDVNIAIHMMADATDGKCQQQVLVSNDSDYATLIEMLKARHPDIIQGVIAPLLPIEKAGVRNREPSKDVIKLSDWNRYPIQKSIFEQCQLPEKVPNHKNKTIFKPTHWV